MANTYKRRRGDRKDGRWLRDLDPYYAITPFIMRQRNDSCNLFSESVEITEADRYLRRKRQEGKPGMGMLHLFIAAYVRTVSQRPGINRFVSGQRIYARNNIEYVMSIKKRMASDGGETSIKLVFEPTDTIDDVYDKMTAAINSVRNEGQDTKTDDLAGVLMKLPRPILQLAVKLILFLDYFGLLPRFVLNASPFHGSFIITDMGSLGIPPIHHHLYNLGNLPVFLSFGAKRRQMEVQADGSVKEKKYIDFCVVTDERICDGFYYAQAFKHIKSYLRHPEVLDNPPEQVIEDNGK